MKLPPAPTRFIPANNVLWAKLSNPPGFATLPQRRSGRRLQGIKYEKLVQDMLRTQYGDSYLDSPWLQFQADSGIKWCQPDGVLIDFEAGALTLIEVKYQHTTDAWWQMRRLYEPVLRTLFPPHLWSISCLEVVKWYDPSVLFPEPTRLVSSISSAQHLPHGTTGIHIWKP